VRFHKPEQLVIKRNLTDILKSFGSLIQFFFQLQPVLAVIYQMIK